MKDEILNKLLEYFKKSNINDFGYEKDKLISYKEAQLLLDYITNLQEENERLKEKIDILKSNFEVEIDDCEDYKKWYRDYKSRCEKAIEYIKQQDMKYYGAVVETKMGIILHILGGDE